MRGSVIVIVDISGSGGEITGANLTLLIMRLQHDVSTSISNKTTVSRSVGTVRGIPYLYMQVSWFSSPPHPRSTSQEL